MCCKYCGHGSGVITPSSFVGLIDLYKMLGDGGLLHSSTVLCGHRVVLYICKYISINSKCTLCQCTLSVVKYKNEWDILCSLNQACDCALKPKRAPLQDREQSEPHLVCVPVDIGIKGS